MVEAGIDALIDGELNLRSPLGRRAAVAAIWLAMASRRPSPEARDA